MSDIGPGSFIVRIRPSPDTPLMRVGSVWCVSGIEEDAADACRLCGYDGAVLLLVNDPFDNRVVEYPDGTVKYGWCPCGFRPYHGPEQASRKASEPTTTTRGTEVVG